MSELSCDTPFIGQIGTLDLVRNQEQRLWIVLRTETPVGEYAQAFEVGNPSSIVIGTYATKEQAAIAKASCISKMRPFVETYEDMYDDWEHDYGDDLYMWGLRHSLRRGNPRDRGPCTSTAARPHGRKCQAARAARQPPARARGPDGRRWRRALTLAAAANPAVGTGCGSALCAGAAARGPAGEDGGG